MVNVAVQLHKLGDHPLHAPALADGHVQVTGLFFDIATACVTLVTADGIEQLDNEHCSPGPDVKACSATLTGRWKPEQCVVNEEAALPGHGNGR